MIEETTTTAEKSTTLPIVEANTFIRPRKKAGRPPLPPELKKPKPAPKQMGKPRTYLKVLPEYPPEEMKIIKLRILQLMCTGEYSTVRRACADVELPDGSIGFNPVLAHMWRERDRDWNKQLKMAKEVVADILEEKLLASRNDVAAIFMLKGIRPEYRDNHKIQLGDDNTKSLLEELRALGKHAEPTVDGSAPEPSAPPESNNDSHREENKL